MPNLVITALFNHMMRLFPNKFSTHYDNGVLGLYSGVFCLLQEDIHGRPSHICTGNHIIRSLCKDLHLDYDTIGYMNIAHPNAIKLISNAIKSVIDNYGD